MDTQAIDERLVAAVFEQAGLVGWGDVNLVEAAREAGLDVAAVRARFPGKTAVLLTFGRLADQAALAACPKTGLPREKLFDLLMARFDVLQRHRAGVLSLMDALRFDPGTALMLGGATLRSMRWMLDAAGVPAGGAAGALRVPGLAAVWAYALRAWEKDDTTDMGAVMAALDRALDRAVQAEEMLPGHRGSPAPEPPLPAPAPLLAGGDVLEADGGPAVL